MVRKEREPPTYRPNVGDRIICMSNGVLYEAKVLNIGKDPKDTEKNPDTKCLVHYQGWNKNWDEYVKFERIQEWNDANVKAMKETRTKATKAQAKGPGSGRKRLSQAQLNQSNTSIATSNDSLVEPIEIESEPPVIIDDREIKIKMPEELRNWLIDDDNNMKNKKLTVLPAKPPITVILKEFVTYKKNTNRLTQESVLSELTLGIKDYFNVMLGSHLLCKFERLQYQNLLKEHGKDVDLAAHYGIIHLVRLFTKIGKALANSTLEPQNIQVIVGYMHDLLKYLSKQTNLFDLEKNYTVAPPDYIKNALK